MHLHFKALIKKSFLPRVFRGAAVNSVQITERFIKILAVMVQAINNATSLKLIYMPDMNDMDL